MNGYKISDDLGVDGLLPRAVGIENMRLREFSSWRGIRYLFVVWGEGVWELKGEDSYSFINA